MKIKVIGCKVMLRQLYRLAADSPNTADILWMRQELHETPGPMAGTLQAAVDAIEAEATAYDAIVLAYGLCSNGVVGLHAKRTPLVMARAHDCITLFLGDRRRYQRLFTEGGGGIYWYAQGWIENTRMPGARRMEELRLSYIDRYGEENASYLLEQERSWLKAYHTAAYIAWPGDAPFCETFTRDAADCFGWRYERCEGDDALLRDLLGGAWDADRYLVVPPGCRIVADHGDGIVACAPTP